MKAGSHGEHRDRKHERTGEMAFVNRTDVGGGGCVVERHGVRPATPNGVLLCLVWELAS